VDFSKAFETLDPKILLSNLVFYGMRGSGPRIVKSYLSRRKQYVVLHGVSSK